MTPNFKTISLLIISAAALSVACTKNDDKNAKVKRRGYCEMNGAISKSIYDYHFLDADSLYTAAKDACSTASGTWTDDVRGYRNDELKVAFLCAKTERAEYTLTVLGKDLCPGYADYFQSLCTEGGTFSVSGDYKTGVDCSVPSEGYCTLDNSVEYFKTLTAQVYIVQKATCKNWTESKYTPVSNNAYFACSKPGSSIYTFKSDSGGFVCPRDEAAKRSTCESAGGTFDLVGTYDLSC